MPTFSDLLKNFYDKEPDRVALYVLFSGQPDRPLTYRQLLQGATAYARAFAEHGVQPGEVVVLILQHSYDLIYAFFGAILHGAIPSIMPFLTEKLLPERYRADLAATWPKDFVPATGATAQIRMISYHQAAAIAIPNKALNLDPKGWSVNVKLADGKTERRPVKRGRVSKEDVEILSGLEVGQVIVTPQTETKPKG